VPKTERAPGRSGNTPFTAAEQAEIDRLYGLDPLLEPGMDGDAALGLFATIDCPYCGESFSTPIDLTAGSQQYIEDCQICCQNILLTIEVDGSGGLSALRTARTDAD
jgi:hypothetical protein